MQVKKWVLSALSFMMAGAAFAHVPENLGERLAQQYVRPAMADFAVKTAALHGALDAWCKNEGRTDVTPVRQAFAHTVQAWAGIEFLRFGPLVQENRYEKLAFWPDPRGVVQRQVLALLAAQDPAALKPDALASRSVAMQGLPALEYVLYDTPGLISDSSPKTAVNPYACHYAVAVASNVLVIAGELQQAWSDKGRFGQEFTSPSATNPLYRNQQEVAAEAVKALSTGLEFARNVKLVPALADSSMKSRAKQAAWWRSNMTIPTLIASIQGVNAFYEAGGYQYPPTEVWVGTSFTGELQAAVKTLKGLDQPWLELVMNDASWKQLSLVSLVLKNAKNIVDQHIAPALGVTIGFNALDGD